MRNVCIILATLILTLGFAPVMAGVDCDKKPTHPQCTGGGGDDPLGLPFSVEIMSHDTGNSPLFNPRDLDNDELPCLAQAHDHSTNFNVTFFGQECAILEYSGPEPNFIKVLGFHVTRNKKIPR